jgi:hypothetical protein
MKRKAVNVRKLGVKICKQHMIREERSNGSPHLVT